MMDHHNLTFLAALDAYIEVLRDRPGKALRVTDDEAVFLEQGQIYSVALNDAGEIEIDTAGCLSQVVWDECEDSAELCVSAINARSFIDIPAT
jgi:hypothetical protein